MSLRACMFLPSVFERAPPQTHLRYACEPPTHRHLFTPPPRSILHHGSTISNACCGAAFLGQEEHKTRKTRRKTKKDPLPDTIESAIEVSLDSTSPRRRGRKKKAQQENLPDNQSPTLATNPVSHNLNHSEWVEPILDAVRHVENAEEKSGSDPNGLLQGRPAEEKDGQSVDTKKKKTSRGRGRTRKSVSDITFSDVARKDSARPQDGFQDKVMEVTDNRELNMQMHYIGLADNSLDLRQNVVDRKAEDEPEEGKIKEQDGEGGTYLKPQQEQNTSKGKRGRTSRKRKETTDKKGIIEPEFLEKISEGCLAMNSVLTDGKGELNVSMKQTHSLKPGRKESTTDAHSNLRQELEKKTFSCIPDELGVEKDVISSTKKKSKKKSAPLATLMDMHTKFPNGKVEDQDYSPKEEIKASCTVTWIAEANLTAHQKLFVTGSSPFLGAWEPSTAIPLSSCEEKGHVTLYKGQAQVPFGTTSEYNYFIKILDAHSEIIIWRPGARLSLHVSSAGGFPNEMLVINDTLGFTVIDKLLSPSWGAWWKDLGIPPQLSKLTGVRVAIPEHVVKQKSEALEKDPAELVNKQTVANKFASTGRILKDVSVDDKDITSVDIVQEGNFPVHLSPEVRKYLLKKKLPREEPGLMETIIMDKKLEAVKIADMYNVESQEEVHHTILESSSLMQTRPNIPTEILINSSECTMERIAILEEGKLVELLLEPVDSEIRVGNVYLGVVKKLVPGMTGVFVDIGAPRTALLSITKNTYPYTFPPLNPRVQSDGSVRSNSVAERADGGDDDVSEESQYLFEEDLLADEDQVVENTDDDEDDDDDDDNDDEESTEEAEELEEELEGLAYEVIANPCRRDIVMRGEEHLERNSANLGMISQDEVDNIKKRPVTVNFGRRFTRWRKLEEGMKIIVQVRREALGKKGPQLSAFPNLSSRFWVLISEGGNISGVSKKIIGLERKRLKHLAESLRPPGFGLTARTEAAGQPSEELEKDFTRLLETWRCIEERAESASVAADGDNNLVPVLLHRATSQTLSVARDFFVERVQRMVVDSSRTYQEVTEYLEGVAPHLLNRVELYTGKMPIFDAFNLELEIDKFLSKRVGLPNGAYLVIEETEALVSIDVNGGVGMLRRNATQSTAILEVNLAAAQQIARQLRLRDIGGIIVIDFIDMNDAQHEKMVYEEMRKAIQHDRSFVNITEISELGVMEIIRKRVRPSVTRMISDPCLLCHGTGRVEALETTLCKIERAILRFLASNSKQPLVGEKMWPKILLRVDPAVFDYLTRRQRATRLSSALKVYLVLKVGRELHRGQFEVSELTVGAEKRHASDGQQNTTRKNGRPVLMIKRGSPYKARQTT